MANHCFSLDSGRFIFPIIYIINVEPITYIYFQETLEKRFFTTRNLLIFLCVTNEALHEERLFWVKNPPKHLDNRTPDAAIIA